MVLHTAYMYLRQGYHLKVAGCQQKPPSTLLYLDQLFCWGICLILWKEMAK